jgi:hypothetical protein
MREQALQRLAGQHQRVPGLHVAARRRTLRLFQHALQHGPIDRIGQEPADGSARGDGLGHGASGGSRA